MGVADKEKLSRGLATRATEVLCVRAPLAPVIVTVYAPDGVVLLVLTIRVEELEPVTEVGLKLALAPVGSPPALKLTVPVKPFNAVTVAVNVVFEPWVTVCEDGVADKEKSGVALTTRVTEALRVRAPHVPVIFSV